ncbi:hypothetical protein P7K49_035776, partial [Saguinus oedipus]
MQSMYKVSGAATKTRLQQVNWLELTDSKSSWPKLMSGILKQKEESRERKWTWMTARGPGAEAKTYHTEADRS